MRKYLSPLIAIAAILLLFYFISRVEKKVETKKVKREIQTIQANVDTMAILSKSIAHIEYLNTLLANCQKNEQATRREAKIREIQLMKTIDEKISNNPNPNDNQLLREIADLADLINTARSADSVAR